MESHKIPKIALLSEKERKNLTTLLEKLCSEKKIGLLDKQLDSLNENLKNIRSFNEVSFFNKRLVIISSYLAFANALLAYAATQEIIAPSSNASISNLNTRFATLDAEKAANDRSIKVDEKAHRAGLAAKNLSSSSRSKVHTRTGSDLGRLISNLAKLDKGQTSLLAKMAEIANELIGKGLILEVIHSQLSQLPENEISAFYNADVHIKLAKTEKQLEGYCNGIRNWLAENNVLLNACNKSLALIKIIDIHLISKLRDEEINSYKALSENKDLIRKYLPTASSIIKKDNAKTHLPITNPIINKINRIFDFQANIDALQAERLETLKNPNSPFEHKLEHKRERSKSQGYITAPVGTKFKFFTSGLSSLALNKTSPTSSSSPLLRQHSTHLPTKWRELKDPKNKQVSEVTTPSKRK